MNRHCHCNHQPEPIQHSLDCACCYCPPAIIGAAAVKQDECVRLGADMSPMFAMHWMAAHRGEVYGTNYDLRSGDYLVWKLCPHVGLMSRHVGYPASWRLTCTSYFMRGQYWEKRP